MAPGKTRTLGRLGRGVRKGRSLIIKPILLLAGLSVIGGTACYGPPPVELPSEEQMKAILQEPAASQPAAPEASDAAQELPDGEPADAS